MNIALFGPPGAGKGTLVHELHRRIPNLWVSVSATTRPPRPNESDGVDYFFLTPIEFDARERAGEFLEEASVHGNRYGTLRGPVERRLSQGMDVILEIDPQGAVIKCRFINALDQNLTKCTFLRFGDCADWCMAGRCRQPLENSSCLERGKRALLGTS